MRAARDGWLGENGLGFIELAADQGAHQQAGFARGPAHPAVMAHAHEAFGQDMGEPAFEEIIDGRAMTCGRLVPLSWQSRRMLPELS